MIHNLGYLIILAVSILSAWQVRKRNCIEAFLQDTSFQRYQLPITSPYMVFVTIPLCFILAIRRQLSISFGTIGISLYICLLFISHIDHIRTMDPQSDSKNFRNNPPGVFPTARYAISMMILDHYLVSSDYSSYFLGYFVHISICYAVLLALLPLLRRCISSRVCGYLWLLPLMAFPFFRFGLSMVEPLLVIHTPIRLTNTLVVIWAIGFIAILLWYFLSHLHFRRQLLRNAKPVNNPEIQKLWLSVLNVCYFKQPLPTLLYSPNTATPLSIGRAGKNMCVVLPEKDYSLEDLRLIFYHELIHTGRDDVNTKLCFSLLAAFFWFNPLMWIALHRITEDLELSCDETTLLCEKDATRHHYADLLLSTAADSRGFSTCLSASAKSLRHRLKNILTPRNRLNGYLIVGLFCLLFLLFQGSIAFSYNQGSGADYIFPSTDASEYTISYIRRNEYYDSTGSYEPPVQYHCTDSEALYDYLISLNLSCITGSSYDHTSYSRYTICYVVSEGKVYIDLRDSTIVVSSDIGNRHYRYLYYHGGTIDWEYFRSLLGPYNYMHETEETQPAETQPKIPILPPHKS